MTRDPRTNPSIGISEGRWEHDPAQLVRAQSKTPRTNADVHGGRARKLADCCRGCQGLVLLQVRYCVLTVELMCD
jgi:hypothetical protein